ncbi:hypothetical protein NIES4071_105250 (plasmid) [Calothrix sp. NIES-4071]|nr:hypothetical protein NIES4071_105250 [Calothrix sp. NIES-4071]BAZ64943.1 hypothetical protein NIES4105_106760 [Calothrix sp. NIES-4105]
MTINRVVEVYDDVAPMSIDLTTHNLFAPGAFLF